MSHKTKVPMAFMPLDAQTMRELRVLARLWKTSPDKAVVRLIKKRMAERDAQ